jgi:hypothetical protein
MVTKERLHELVDRLPDAEVATAARVLEALGGVALRAPFQAIESVPFDDEPEDGDEAAAVHEALVELDKGDFISHAHVRRT